MAVTRDGRRWSKLVLTCIVVSFVLISLMNVFALQLFATTSIPTMDWIEKVSLPIVTSDYGGVQTPRGLDASGDGSSPLTQSLASRSDPVASIETKDRTKFYLYDFPQLTTDLIARVNGTVGDFYNRNRIVNEVQIEVWLHRAYERMTEQGGRTMDPNEDSIFLIPFYAHIRPITSPVPNVTELIQSLLVSHIIPKHRSKPHLLLCPGNNPKDSRVSGIPDLVGSLLEAGVNLYSVGIERNPSWQGGLPVERILPIPYLVQPIQPSVDEAKTAVSSHERTNNSIFYVGTDRENAVRWSGCNRKMVLPLVNATNMFVRLVGRNEQALPQTEYNKRMASSEFCLIVCGDTPTSRSLASAIVNGCIPIRIGARLRGMCWRPCKPGFGWQVSGREFPHLPYPEVLPWDRFPEVSEKIFTWDPEATLWGLLKTMSESDKDDWRRRMVDSMSGWIYGFGDPLQSERFGEAADYILNSFSFFLQTQEERLSVDRIEQKPW